MLDRLADGIWWMLWTLVAHQQTHIACPCVCVLCIDNKTKRTSSFCSSQNEWHITIPAQVLECSVDEWNVPQHKYPSTLSLCCEIASIPYAHVILIRMPITYRRSELIDSLIHRISYIICTSRQHTTPPQTTTDDNTVGILMLCHVVMCKILRCCAAMTQSDKLLTPEPIRCVEFFAPKTTI